MVERSAHNRLVLGSNPSKPIANNEFATLDENTLYWLAGLLEGEASFLRTKSSTYTYPKIVIHMRDEDVIARVAEIFGNKYVYVKARKEHWHATYLTKLQGERAAILMEMLYPLMGQRRQEQIKRALENYTHKSLYRARYSTNAKLTIEDVKLIKRRIAKGETAKSIAKDFGVTHYTIWAISGGKTWVDVQPDE